ncbi:nucleoid-associated protein [Clostridium tagluense]|uniref:nucleoid-associated protein n=1 Tax=Clostridium tagluense TaxID=360422 RepID=UPI001CF35175|nr:nucleoid-associated protein [Clostridium tagluense]MCB2300374.1 nucleoid-associated protein [Clostridium tagluense]
MDKIRDISIIEAVLHVLDTGADEPILNSYMMELTEERYKFILSHIERVLKDENLKYASFKAKNTIVKEVGQDYLNGRIDLNIASKEIVKGLFEIMKDNESISSCDLLVVSFNTEYGPMLGILKMDYVKQYTHQIDIVDSNVGIGLIPITTGLSASKKVQKAAFIRPIRDDQEYDLLVFDKKPVIDTDGINYFLDNFLGCSLIENDRDATRHFMNRVELWTRSNCKDEAVKAERIRTSVKRILRNNEDINIYDIAEQVILPYEPEVKKDFIAYFQECNLEKFQVDKEYLEKKLSNLKIKVSSDIELSITADAYADINNFEIKDNGDGSITMMIKYIENYVEK